MLAMIIAVGGSGCDSNPTSDSPETFSTPCLVPLSRYCGGPRPCPTYDEAVRLMTAGAESTCRGPLGSLRMGTCGEYRFTSSGHVYRGETRYFDRDGDLVAASVSSDTNEFCDRESFSAVYGRRLDCTVADAIDLCAPFRP